MPVQVGVSVPVSAQLAWSISVSMLLWMAATQPLSSQSQCSILLQQEQRRSKQDLDIPAQPERTYVWRQRFSATVAADGQTAVVRLPFHGRMHEYKLMSTSVYSSGAVINIHVAPGKTIQKDAALRSFSSHIPGRRAKASIQTDGAVSGLFQHGQQFVRIRPVQNIEAMNQGRNGMSALQESAGLLHSLSVVRTRSLKAQLMNKTGSIGAELAVDDVGPEPDNSGVLHDVLAPLEGDEVPSIEGSDQEWTGVQWFPGCYPGDRDMHAFQIGVATDHKAWQLHGENLQGVVESIIGEASLIYEAQMNVKLEIGDLEMYSHSDPGSQPPWVSGCDSGNEVRSKLSDFTDWSPPSRQAVWHLFTGCGTGWGVVGVAYLGRICSSFANTGVNMLRNHRGMVVEDTWDVFAHELGHNFNAQHSFEDGRGSTGGIMDYGDGKLNGIYQFNTKYRKVEMCTELSTKKASCGGLLTRASGSTPQPMPSPTPRPTEAPTPSPTPSPAPSPVPSACVALCGKSNLKLQGKGCGFRKNKESCLQSYLQAKNYKKGWSVPCKWNGKKCKANKNAKVDCRSFACADE